MFKDFDNFWKENGFDAAALGSCLSFAAGGADPSISSAVVRVNIPLTFLAYNHWASLADTDWEGKA